jgi:hypothetical protein
MCVSPNSSPNCIYARTTAGFVRDRLSPSRGWVTRRFSEFFQPNSKQNQQSFPLTAADPKAVGNYIDLSLKCYRVLHFILKLKRDNKLKPMACGSLKLKMLFLFNFFNKSTEFLTSIFSYNMEEKFLKIWNGCHPTLTSPPATLSSGTR